MGTWNLSEVFDEPAATVFRGGDAIRHSLRLHDSRRPIAAVTADERRPAFQRCIESNRRVLQLIEAFKRELLSFPASTNDYQVDALSQLLTWIHNRTTNTAFQTTITPDDI